MCQVENVTSIVAMEDMWRMWTSGKFGGRGYTTIIINTFKEFPFCQLREWGKDREICQEIENGLKKRGQVVCVNRTLIGSKLIGTSRELLHISKSVRLLLRLWYVMNNDHEAT